MADIRVQDEQGNIHVFPDGSTPEMISQAMNVKPPSSTQRGIMDSVGDFASEFWKQINPVSALQGAKQLTAHPIDTFKADAGARQQVYQQAENAFKKGNYTEGAAHLLYSVLPLVGPQLNEAANNFLQGNYAKGAGASVGMGAGLVAPEYAGKALSAAKTGAQKAALLGRTPQEAYLSAMKPSTTIPEAQRVAAAQTGLEQNIPVSKAGLEKIADGIDDLNTAISDKIKTGQSQGVTVNPFKVASKLGETADKFATQVAPDADLRAISKTGNEFLKNQGGEPIPIEKAQAMKQGTYKVLQGKYGEQGSASVEAQKALARGLKDEIANQFPEIQGLNAAESKLLNLQPLLERAVARIGNHQMLGIGTPITAGATKAVTGSGKLAAVAAVMKAVLDDPNIKSRIAIAVQRGSKGTISQSQALSRIEGYGYVLSQAASPDNAVPQSGQNSQ